MNLKTAAWLSLAVCAWGLLVLVQNSSADKESPPYALGQDWSNYVRIAAYGLRGGDAAEIVRKAQASNVFGIEVDNDIPGRYESFLRCSAVARLSGFARAMKTSG